LDEIQDGHPTINASTVYRTLSAFRDRGLTSETDLGTGELSYSWLGDERHHHLICRECNATIELGHASLAQLRTAILEEHGFEATVDHFAIFGLCRHCADGGARSGAPSDESAPSSETGAGHA
jgi:Fur family ferric uptake transcriptional regulator